MNRGRAPFFDFVSTRFWRRPALGLRGRVLRGSFGGLADGRRETFETGIRRTDAEGAYNFISIASPGEKLLLLFSIARAAPRRRLLQRLPAHSRPDETVSAVNATGRRSPDPMTDVSDRGYVPSSAR